MILVGDIGGTNTRLALFDREKMIVEKKFPSKKYTHLEEIVAEFLKEQKHPIRKACFGIAGPIRGGKCKTTNLPWEVDSVQMAKKLGIPSVHLLNDLEAKAYGLKLLKKEELFLIQKGVEQTGNQAMVAAGTGLGEAGMYWNGKEHLPFACEGGHTDFAPRDEKEIELFLYLKKKYGHVSYERVVSGPGIALLYHFLIETKKEKESPDVKEAMKHKDAPLVISEWSEKHKDPACVHAIDWFLSLYGAESGNWALKMLSFGGVFIGGGIAPHFTQKMKTGAFLHSFLDKGRFRSLLESMPIFVILNDDASLLGCVYFAEGS